MLGREIKIYLELYIFPAQGISFHTVSPVYVFFVVVLQLLTMVFWVLQVFNLVLSPELDC